MSAEQKCVTCSHPISRHEAGECWTDADGNSTRGETSCRCGWLEPEPAWPIPVRPEGWLDDVLDQAHERYKEVPLSMRLVPEMESAANDPSGTRQERIRRAADHMADDWLGGPAGDALRTIVLRVGRMHVDDDLTAAVDAFVAAALPEADRAAARSLLGEPEVDRG